MNKQPEIALGVAGGVACYKAAALVRALRARGAGVRVAMSAAAARLVAPATFRALSCRPVVCDEWRAPIAEDGMDHIHFSRNADAFLVAPATADILAKMAAGICDDTLTAAIAAAACPIFAAPAMNAQMWKNPANQRNINRLSESGVVFFGPESGEQACGENGAGRMCEPEDIAAQLFAALDGGAPHAAPNSKKPLAGLRVVISAGATAEPLDDMRIISNCSSGRMGFALAAAAREAGASVHLVAGRAEFPPPPDIPVTRADSAAQMHRALLEACAGADLFISAAAVSDFAPVSAASGKIPRASSGKMRIELAPTADILAAVCAMKNAPFCVGFAAEAGGRASSSTPAAAPSAAMLARARQKMKKKGAAMMVVNDLSTAGREDCTLVILDASGKDILLSRQKKEMAARVLINHIAASLQTAKGKTSPKSRNVSRETKTRARRA